MTDTLLLHTPGGVVACTRASGAEASAALTNYLLVRRSDPFADTTPSVMQAVRLPAVEVNGDLYPSVVVLVDAEYVSECPAEPEPARRHLRPVT